MKQRTVLHRTIVIERKVRASCERVFKAWAETEEVARWSVPGEGWENFQVERDFVAGGRELFHFGPKGDPRFRCDGSFIDIVPNQRIISAGAMYDGATRVSTSLCTVELLEHKEGTRLIMTDQSVFFVDGENPEDRKLGWEQMLDKLEAHLKLSRTDEAGK